MSDTMHTVCKMLGLIAQQIERLHYPSLPIKYERKIGWKQFKMSAFD